MWIVVGLVATVWFALVGSIAVTAVWARSAAQRRDARRVLELILRLGSEEHRQRDHGDGEVTGTGNMVGPGVD